MPGIVSFQVPHSLVIASDTLYPLKGEKSGVSPQHSEWVVVFL